MQYQDLRTASTQWLMERAHQLAPRLKEKNKSRYEEMIQLLTVHMHATTRSETDELQLRLTLQDFLWTMHEGLPWLGISEQRLLKIGQL